MNAAQFSRSLGWFSLGLGLAELIAPRKLASAIGLNENHDRLLRAMGARELVSGFGLLARPKSTAFCWSRVAGDIMDLTLLGAALTQTPPQSVPVSRSLDDDRRRLTWVISAMAAVTILDVITSVRLNRPAKLDPH